jgi:hypothetical protein
MNDTTDRQALLDAEHLRLLALGYTISAAISAFFSLIGLFYMAMGGLIVLFAGNVPVKPNEPPPEFMGGLFAAIGLAMFLLLVAFAAAKLVVARNIKRRRGKVFCLVVAGFSCLGIPYGTLLGVASFIVLQRPSVARLFDAGHTA